MWRGSEQEPELAQRLSCQGGGRVSPGPSPQGHPRASGRLSLLDHKMGMTTAASRAEGRVNLDEGKNAGPGAQWHCLRAHCSGAALRDSGGTAVPPRGMFRGAPPSRAPSGTAGTCLQGGRGHWVSPASTNAPGGLRPSRGHFLASVFKAGPHPTGSVRPRPTLTPLPSRRALGGDLPQIFTGLGADLRTTATQSARRQPAPAVGAPSTFIRDRLESAETCC